MVTVQEVEEIKQIASKEIFKDLDIWLETMYDDNKAFHKEYDRIKEKYMG
jgi:hypothetical protein